MPGHQHINVLRKKMGPQRVAKAKARAKELQATRKERISSG